MKSLKIVVPKGLEVSESDAKLLLAIGLFRESKITLKQAALLADLCVEDFMKELSKRNISIVNWNLKELKEELENAQNIAKQI
ncbi:MAG: UPF0175 family protein [Nitrososphaerota archaeon]